MLMVKYVPLKGSFMIASVVGLLVSAIYIANFSVTWGFALSVVFVLMFIASIISMTKAPVK